jgi:hypothetical protein
MQVWTPAPSVRGDGEFAVRLSPGDGKPFAVIDLSEDGETALVVKTPAECDRLIRAAMALRSMLLGETSGPLPPYVSPYTAASAAEVADGVDACPAQWGATDSPSRCARPSGHDGNHEDTDGIAWAGHWETAEPDADAVAADALVGPCETGEQA